MLLSGIFGARNINNATPGLHLYPMLWMEVCETSSSVRSLPIRRASSPLSRDTSHFRSPQTERSGQRNPLRASPNAFPCLHRITASIPVPNQVGICWCLGPSTKLEALSRYYELSRFPGFGVSKPSKYVHCVAFHFRWVHRVHFPTSFEPLNFVLVK